MPIQTFALSSGKVPAAKPMHTGTLGKTSRGGVNRSYFEDTPSGSRGAGFLAGRGASPQNMGLRQPEPNGWPGRGEKSVYRLTKARTGAALRQAPAQKKRGGRRATLLVPPRGVACGASGRRITSGLALSSPPLTCAGSEIATNPGDQGSAAQCGQGEVRPDIEGHGAPPRSYWAPQPQPALYSVWAQAAVAGSTQWR